LVSHTCLCAELLAALANRGFIFSARPAKVKTYYSSTAPVAAAFQGGHFLSTHALLNKPRANRRETKINQINFFEGCTAEKPPTNRFLLSAR
jgi:hypothetical protein